MIFTPMLLGVTLVFWGWHTGLWWLGLLLGVLAELPPYLSGYREFELREQQRVADLCSLLSILAGIYLVFTQPHLGAVVIHLMQWAPALFFPLLALQLYGKRQSLELSVLFPSLRRSHSGGNEQIDVRHFYLLGCLLGTAMVEPPGKFYYLGLGLITIWMLWPLRSLSFTPWRWSGALILALSIGYGVGTGLAQLQAALEEHAVAWLAGYFNEDSDPYRTTTAIGDIGRLKLSEQIVLRLWTDTPVIEPLLLRSTSFTRYINGTWLAEPEPFKPLTYDTQGWHLPNVGKSQHWVKIATELQHGRGILPLPNGSSILQGLDAAQLTGNNAGVVRMIDGPTLAHYRVEYSVSATDNLSVTPAASRRTIFPDYLATTGDEKQHPVSKKVESSTNWLSLPNDIDLRVPPLERPALDQVVKKLKLSTLPVAQALQRIEYMFQHDFHYNLQLQAPPSGSSALAYFLTQSRSGHCEYFASAAVLLLRQAGIPARYAQGWSVQEYSDLEHAYLARARHAHAWVLVWEHGAWHDFDPTPADWIHIEAEKRPWWGTIQDLWSWLHYRLAMQGEQQQISNWVFIVILIALVGLLGWRITKHGRHASKKQALSSEVTQELITIFTQVETTLTARTGPRYLDETLRTWLLRLQRQGESSIAELLPALNLYYRQRFDPNGLDEHDSYRLKLLIERWVGHNNST